MSVRKRTWKSPNGETKEAWVVDYVDQRGERHIKTFAKKRDAEARRVQEKALTKARAEVVSRTDWESVYDQLSRQFAALTNKSQPQTRARYLQEAVEIVAEARRNQTARDELGERNFARCIERAAQYADVPSALVAVQILQKTGEL